MNSRPAALLTFAVVAVLVAGGLGWVTRQAVQLDGLQRAQQAEAEVAARLRVALWKLDRVGAVIAREDSRPFNHYSAVFVPALALDGRGWLCRPGTVVETSPLLSAELPDWMLLHFHADPEFGWESPQVLSPGLSGRLRSKGLSLALGNVTPARRQLLDRLTRDVPSRALLDLARAHASGATTRDSTLVRARIELEQANEQNKGQAGGQTGISRANPQSQQVTNTSDFIDRSDTDNRLLGRAGGNKQLYARNIALLNFQSNGEEWLANNSIQMRQPPGEEVEVRLAPLTGLWLTGKEGDHLVLVRLVRVADRESCQGILVDAAGLKEILLAEVRPLFPDADLRPVPAGESAPPERAMTALPFQLDPGPSPEPPPDEPGWTPLGVGLALAWCAAGVALLAIGLVGWGLLDLSDRRVRFVQAVTHELRTPLTTLRLYLDMLLGGMVREPDRQREYLTTLNAEADRLHRLVANVLDHARLENSNPRAAPSRVDLAAWLTSLQEAWGPRCLEAGKDLVVENASPPGTALLTDPELLHRVVGNLIDNACKYSREATDNRLWVRVRRGRGVLTLEVEDRGPGVTARERRSIFRPFRRGHTADATAGGVGLGLALAARWARLLGGRLTLHTPPEGGACFRVGLKGLKGLGPDRP